MPGALAAVARRTRGGWGPLGLQLVEADAWGKGFNRFRVRADLVPGTPYIVTRDGGSDERPLWKVFAVLGDVEPDSSLFDPALIEERQWPALVWRKDRGAVEVPRQARCLCLGSGLAFDAIWSAGAFRLIGG